MNGHKYKNFTLLKWEIKKIWSLPMISVFFLLCIVFNALLVLNTAGQCGREGLGYIRFINSIITVTGNQMGFQFDQKLELLPEFHDIEGSCLRFRQTLISETKGLTDQFDTCSTSQIGDFLISRYRITGPAADALVKKYAKLQSSADALASRDASLSLSAAGMTKPLLDSLFGTLCRAVITEGILLAILTALYTYGNDRLSRTCPIVYASKTGRHIQLIKAAAGLLASLTAYVLLAAVSVLVFAAVIRPGSIWAASVSSQFHYQNVLGLRLPFITWIPFTTAGYLSAVLALGAAAVTIFYGFGFLSGLTAGNTYKGFLLCFAGFALNFEALVLSGEGGLWMLYEALQWTPAAFWWNQPAWFTDMGISALLPWQESLVAVFCTLFCTGLLLIAFRRFYKEDII